MIRKYYKITVKLQHLKNILEILKQFEADTVTYICYLYTAFQFLYFSST